MLAKHLASHETLILWRRRKGLTQWEAAQGFELTLYAYRQWEKGHGSPRMRVQTVWPHEYFVVRRLRHGLTIGKMAEAVGCSRQWMGLMERGEVPLDRLTKYWGC